MKSLFPALVVATLLAAPVASFAQSNQPLTRAEVRAQLVQLEKAGYNPVGDQTDYPNNIQAAQRRVDEQSAVAQADTSGYGAASNGSSQAGVRSVIPAPATGPSSVYFGH
ncbi:hypothetical protein BWP39_24795 [Paraburkholderia acidicola]|uniref:DUF4148 domain-containing protein n=1 Tax=Paraburkholderia acidicola TaxID=1912599 RepID=A0A2A4ERI6_9BURK|nr:DUF4148 domain-containing protein [Paraburkholderia acidicola]PCE22904.1 hypothetical protein BWP39_24795 [Paraburkholderia acidicola]